MSAGALASRQPSRTSFASSTLVLVAGVLLTSATQLRPSAYSVGPGELLLIAWSCWAGARLLLAGNVRSDPAALSFVLFWAITGALLALGLCVSLAQPATLTIWFLHDALAFGFAAVLTCLMVNDGRDELYYIKAARFYVVWAGVSFLFLLVFGEALLGGLGVEVWYWARWRGWAENPNQQALFVVAVPFLALYLWSREERVGARAAYVAATLACLAVGIATMSDGLLSAWLAGAGAIILLHGVQHWISGAGSRAALLIYDVIVPAILLGLGWWMLSEGIDYVSKEFAQVYNEGGQGQLRMQLWSDGIDLMLSSLGNFFVGAGPGGRVVFQGRAEEVHNSLIDWGVMTGVVGVAVYCSLLGWLLYRTIRAKTLSLFGLMVAIVVFHLTHFTLRHPVFWLMLVLVANLSTPPARQR